MALKSAGNKQRSDTQMIKSGDGIEPTELIHSI